MGRFLLKLARDSISDNPKKALDYAYRASVSLERCSGSEMELTMSLHVLAAVYCSLGRFDEAVPVLERSVEVLDPTNGLDHALMKFAGFMQLGDSYSMLGQLDRSISCYGSGLEIHVEALGQFDPRVAETCRVGDAIEILEYILKVREEKLGTANPNVNDEKKRLSELLKEVGKSRLRKGKSLKNLLYSNF